MMGGASISRGTRIFFSDSNVPETMVPSVPPMTENMLLSLLWVGVVVTSSFFHSLAVSAVWYRFVIYYQPKLMLSQQTHVS